MLQIPTVDNWVIHVDNQLVIHTLEMHTRPIYVSYSPLLYQALKCGRGA